MSLYDESFPHELNFESSDNSSCDFQSISSISQEQNAAACAPQYKPAFCKETKVNKSEKNRQSVYKKAPPLKKKAQSIEGLNIPTKKRYDHVTSKVKIYIDSLKQQDKTTRFVRYRSLPEVLQAPPTNEIDELTDVSDLKNIILHKNQIITQLEATNSEWQEHYNSLLFETNIERGKLEHKIEMMRIELLQCTEQKRISLNVEIQNKKLFSPPKPITNYGAAIISSNSSYASSASVSPAVVTNQEDDVEENSFLLRKRSKLIADISSNNSENLDCSADQLITNSNSRNTSGSCNSIEPITRPTQKKRRKFTKIIKVFRYCAPCIDKNVSMSERGSYIGLNGEDSAYSSEVNSSRS